MKTTSILFRDFQPGDEAAFRDLNVEWITRFFALEPKDEESFADPQHTIIAFGGRIFLAIELTTEGERAVGCCALIPVGPREYELAKMAVTASAQGSGLGRRLLQHTIDEARAMGAARLYLESNHILGPALHLYSALGFQHLPPERVTPSPYARADVHMELWLGS